MRTALKSVIVAVLLAVVAPLAAAQGQLTDAERASRESARQNELRARSALLNEWDAIVKQEAEREQAGDCQDRHFETTSDYDDCLSEIVISTTARYKRLAEVIRRFLKIEFAVTPDGVFDGPTGKSHTGDEMVKAFDDIEKRWGPYQSALCEAAFMQHQPGTIAPSQSERCEIRVYRSHIKDLNATFQPLAR